MSHSRALYRPSILELAQQGNFRAIAYWLNSLLAPYGIYIQVRRSGSGCLKILVSFHKHRPRSLYCQLQTQLVRFICYRLWTLNSAAIRDVVIAARVVGESTPLWRQSVRIVTPANRGQPPTRSRRNYQRSQAWLRFQVLRSALISRLALAGFLLCYWWLHWELSHPQLPEETRPLTPPFSQTQAQANLIASQPAYQSALSFEPGSKKLEPAPDTAIPPEFQGAIVNQVTPALGQKVVALTFDDGPWETTTEQVLEILNQQKVKATFFWVGLHLQRHPDLARQVVAAGHAIGNHTWRHPLQNLDQPTAAQELSNAARLIYEITGVKTSLFRPPAGNLAGGLVPYAQAQNQTVTLWSVDSHDYYVSAPIIVDNVLRGVKPGSIVLLHDGGGDRSATVQALPQIITALKQQGYRFLTIPQLLELQKQAIATPTTPANQISREP